jgi:hypothetical protein
VELAAAFDAAKSGGVIVAAIAAVFTIGYVANMLGAVLSVAVAKSLQTARTSRSACHPRGGPDRPPPSEISWVLQRPGTECGTGLKRRRQRGYGAIMRAARTGSPIESFSNCKTEFGFDQYDSANACLFRQQFTTAFRREGRNFDLLSA